MQRRIDGQAHRALWQGACVAGLLALLALLAACGGGGAGVAAGVIPAAAQPAC